PGRGNGTHLEPYGPFPLCLTFAPLCVKLPVFNAQGAEIYRRRRRSWLGVSDPISRATLSQPWSEGGGDFSLSLGSTLGRARASALRRPGGNPGPGDQKRWLRWNQDLPAGSLSSIRGEGPGPEQLGHVRTEQGRVGRRSILQEKFQFARFVFCANFI